MLQVSGECVLLVKGGFVFLKKSIFDTGSGNRVSIPDSNVMPGGAGRYWRNAMTDLESREFAIHHNFRCFERSRRWAFAFRRRVVLSFESGRRDRGPGGGSIKNFNSRALRGKKLSA